MTKRILVVTGLVAALAGSSFALAQTAEPQQRPGVGERGGPGGPGGPGRRGPGPRGFAGDIGLRGVELTDAQREQVRGIMQNHQAALQQAGTRLREAHQAFAEAVTAQPLNEAVIRTRSTDVAAAMADEAILRAKVRAEVFQLLTPEQQQQASQHGARRPRQGAKPQQ